MFTLDEAYRRVQQFRQGSLARCIATLESTLQGAARTTRYGQRTTGHGQRTTSFIPPFVFLPVHNAVMDLFAGQFRKSLPQALSQVAVL